MSISVAEDAPIDDGLVEAQVGGDVNRPRVVGLVVRKE